ncbi:MAG: pilus assembly FimT family protein [Woeseiaceae bacterium]
MPVRGYTLTELLIVVAIMGLAATVALPSLSAGDAAKVDQVAAEIANSMRFARSESMRLGNARGFRQQSSAKRIRIFRPDTGTTPPTPVYDVYHPIDKHLFDRQFDPQPFGFSGALSHNRVYRGVCNSPGFVYFDVEGTPWCADPVNVLLDRFEVTVTLGSITRVVTLHGITGRVTVQ